MPNRDLSNLLLRNNDAADATTKQFERELAKRYRSAYAEIEAQIGKLFAKMGDTPSLVEAKRYKRLDNLRAAIIAEYRKLTEYAIDGTRSNSASIYARGAYGTEWAYDQTLGVTVKWPVLSVEAIRASVWNGATGENFSERLRKWSSAEIQTLQTKITQGIALGEGFPKVARRVRDSVNDDYNRVIRIVRTEAMRNYNQAHLEIYDKLDGLGIQANKQWVATLDTKTRDTHGILDGQFADKDGLFHVHGNSTEGPGQFGIAEEDINCRCRLIEVIEDLAPEYRRVRGEGIVPYQTFNDWATSKGWSESKGWPIESKAKLSMEQAAKY